MSIDYETIGRFACEKANDYERSFAVYKDLVEKRKKIDAMIIDAEKKGNKEILKELYNEFRIIKQDQMTNQSYRQKFCDDFLFEISEMMKDK